MHHVHLNNNDVQRPSLQSRLTVQYKWVSRFCSRHLWFCSCCTLIWVLLVALVSAGVMGFLGESPCHSGVFIDLVGSSWGIDWLVSQFEIELEWVLLGCCSNYWWGSDCGAGMYSAAVWSWWKVCFALKSCERWWIKMLRLQCAVQHNEWGRIGAAS